MADLKLNKKLIEKAFPLIAEGNYCDVVYNSLGISKATYFRWLAQGEQDEKDGKQSIFKDFLDSKNEAEAIAELSHVHNIKKSANEGTWQASAWLLERKHKAKWSAKQEVQLSGDEEKPIKVNLKWD